MYDNAKASFTISTNNVCDNILLNTNIDASNNNTQLANYFWYANDSLIGNSIAVPNIRLKNFGDSVRIQLKAKSLFGCVNDSVIRTIYFIPPPKTSFTDPATTEIFLMTRRPPSPTLFPYKMLFRPLPQFITWA